MDYRNVYFLGIGGIGMSAIARYFLAEGINVAGYDRTSTVLTRNLEREGAVIHYEDHEENIPEGFRFPHTTLVVYTPAIPAGSRELVWFRENGFTMEKRSEMLGHITAGKYVMAVAGTHGKTTTSTMTAWFNHIAGGGGSAFLGGISRNFSSNLVLGAGNRIAVEADEFDRSFLRLSPDVAVITSTDPDHLDIYGTHEKMKEAFGEFAHRVKPGGSLILKKGAEPTGIPSGINIYSYDLEDSGCDFHIKNMENISGGKYRFDMVMPDRVIQGCVLGLPGRINVENALAASAMLWIAGFDQEKLKEAIAGFEGVKRRFEFYINTPEIVYMDDYAHHPSELEAAISSLRNMFPDKKLTVAFQPHLYTRTRDFYEGFARSLSLADHVVLLPVYPARELPIEGVSSRMIAEKLRVPYDLVEKEELTEWICGSDAGVIATFGAGNIDLYCEDIDAALRRKHGLGLRE